LNALFHDAEEEKMKATDLPQVSPLHELRVVFREAGARVASHRD